MSRHFTYFTILICLLLGLFLRLYPLETAPYWIDEGFTINAVLSYQNNPLSGIAATLDSGAAYECFLYCKTTSFLTETFGPSSTTFRLLSIIFGLLSLLVIYTATKITFGLRTALLSFVMLTFSYLHIAWSTQARWYTMALTFTWLAILFYVKAQEKNEAPTSHKVVYSLGFLCSTALAVMAHKILLILPLLFLTHYWYTTRTTLSQNMTWFLRALSVGVLGCLWYTAHYYGLLSSVTVQNNLPYYLGFLWNHYWLLIPLAVFSITRKNLSSSQWLLVWVLIGYVLALSFLTDVVHYRYLFMVTPVLFILAAQGALEVHAYLKEKYTKRHGYMFLGILFSLFIISPTGNILPQSQYWLESDSPQPFIARQSHLYTPQPNWNAAYTFINHTRTNDDIIISSHPVFTKIFLNEPGFWIAYDYLGSSNRSQAITESGKEFYVGATPLYNITEIQSLVTTTHGFIIFDHMAQDGRIPADIITYIQNNFSLVYFKEDNPYSAIWIYTF